MNDLLSDDIVTKLVGVIDLRHGQAVHAIAGDRNRYQSVDFCGGNPVALAEHYRRLGVTDLYVADLDAIMDGKVHWGALQAVCGDIAEGTILIDFGWPGSQNRRSWDAIAGLSDRHPNIRWIAATESLASVGNLVEICELVTPPRVYLGLDYRNDRLLGGVDEAQWIDTAKEIGCGGVVVLDLASVGTAAGPSTMQICRRVKRSAPSLSVVSGGGVRTARDVRELIESGCERCLVATALQG